MAEPESDPKTPDAPSAQMGLFDPVPHFGERDAPLPTTAREPPYPADFASLYRTLAPGARREGPDREEFRRRILPVIAVSRLDGRPQPETPGSVLRVLAGLALDVPTYEGRPGLDLDILYELLGIFPAAGGNSLADAYQYELTWLARNTELLRALQASFLDGPCASQGCEALAYAVGLATQVLAAKTKADLQAWGLRPSLLDAVPLGDPEREPFGGTTIILDGRPSVRVSYTSQLQERGPCRVTISLPRPTGGVGHVVVGHVTPKEGFAPSAFGKTLFDGAATPLLRDTVMDVVGATMDYPIASAPLTAGLDLAALEDQFQQRGTIDLGRGGPPGSSGGYALGSLGDDPFEGLLSPEDAKATVAAATGKVPESQFARVRALRLALQLGAKEFLDKLLPRPIAFTDATEYGRVVTEWEARPGELSDIEAMVLAAGLGFPIYPFVNYVSGGLALDKLLPQRSTTAR